MPPEGALHAAVPAAGSCAKTGSQGAQTAALSASLRDFKKPLGSLSLDRQEGIPHPVIPGWSKRTGLGALLNVKLWRGVLGLGPHQTAACMVRPLPQPTPTGLRPTPSPADRPQPQILLELPSFLLFKSLPTDKTDFLHIV